MPSIDPSAFIADTARIIGNVVIHPGVFVGYGAVIRADEAGSDGKVTRIEIGPQCNVQEGVIIHALGGTGVKIGPRCSLAHGSIVHGPCEIGADSFVGFGATIFKANIGVGTFVAARALVQGVEIPAGSSIPPAAKILTPAHANQLEKATESDISFMKEIVETNIKLLKGYKRSECSEQE